ncbi:MAG TPA: hypothetical protein VNK41_06815 [Vicinamibacterales bacterium]|nr:hypothetical protein [Vicinamibacterales bacterium]
MARGWESKQVEDQQAEAARQRELRERRALTPVQEAARQRRETLLLAASTRAALASCRMENHREMLRMQLDAIGRQIAALDVGGGK